VLYGNLRQYLGVVFRKLAEQKESRIEEEHLLVDHVPHDDLDTTEVRRVTSGGVHEG
jgi:hypothetical protein